MEWGSGAETLLFWILCARKGVEGSGWGCGSAWIYLKGGQTLFNSLHKEQPTQNWYGQGESDCLIKTKHCEVVKNLLTQCDFCPVL